MRILSLSLVAGAALALSGCAYNGLGLGVGYGSPYGYASYGSGYDRYGYNPYGYRYGYNPYGYGYNGYGYDPFGRYGYGYGYAPYGWYDGYYYPGSGYYVYDGNNKRREMTPAERTYWRERVADVLANQIRQNRGTTTTNSTGVSTQSVRTESSARAPRATSTRETRQVRSDERRSAAAERRSERREAATARRASRNND